MAGSSRNSLEKSIFYDLAGGRDNWVERGESYHLPRSLQRSIIPVQHVTLLFQQYANPQAFHPDLPGLVLFVNLFFGTVKIISALLKNGRI